MTHTGYDHPETILKARAAGYQLEGDQVRNADYLNMAWPSGAGGLYSTVEDLYKWDQALYSNAVLPESARRLMWTPVLNQYGYGWAVRHGKPGSTSNRFEMAHAGAINGFTSVIRRFASDRVTVIVLANLASIRSDDIGSALSSIVLGEE
jgi:CubicO group peptidase (beta-lactamase class C family)